MLIRVGGGAVLNIPRFFARHSPNFPLGALFCRWILNNYARRRFMSFKTGGYVSAIVMSAVMACGIASATTPISIVASNWKFTPDEITLKAGQPQVLHLTSAEGVHGLQSDELGIKQTMIAPGSAVDVTVTPRKAGIYVLHCSIMCGAGHPNMTLTVRVDQ